MEAEVRARKGASFLLEELAPQAMFTPEDWTKEHHLIAKTTEEFVLERALPCLPEIEEQRFEHSVRLLQEAGELGLVGAEIPEDYGGLGLDKISCAIITEQLAAGRSFALTFGAHVGIGTLPIVFFGTQEQKQKYLPALATAEKIAAYALTEPSSGSDALGAKASAHLSPCGKYYVLNGEKQWITNAGFADLFIVYAKVDGQKFTAFIVEKEFSGVSTGVEEKKMGIKGSSTRTLILNEAQVPVENVLGEIGKGHLIAFNILNIGRYKLAVGCLGSAKRAIHLAVTYAKTRKQFQMPIAQFNLIKAKIAQMAIDTYAAESMVYRTAGLLEAQIGRLEQTGLNNGQEAAKAIAEYAVECSINKVFASELLDRVIDEAVQIHGGYGFMSEYEVENMYRDSRINRIFEGTNEINRLLIPDTLLRKALRGELPLRERMATIQDELLAFLPPNLGDSPLAQENHLLSMSKKIFFLLTGLIVQTFPQHLDKEQELLADIANLTILIYVMESTIKRTEKALLQSADNMEKEQLKIAYSKIFVQESFQRIEAIAKEVLCSMTEGDTLRTMLTLVRKLSRYQPYNTLSIKREIAQKIIAREKYFV